MKRFITASGDIPALHRNSANLMQGILDEVKANIIILPELQSLIPALQKNEFEQLETSICEEGCRDSLLIWQTTQRTIDGTENDSPLNVLIDGHNRYTICKAHTIDFKIVLREFPTLQVVRDFMIDNQLGRRNLTPEQISYLRGLKYRNERQATGRPALTTSIENQVEAERTQDRLAKEFNVSPRTIHRDREYSEGIDKLTPTLKQEVLGGKQKIPKELIRNVGRAHETNSSYSLPDLLNFKNPNAPTNSTEQVQVIDEITSIVKQITIMAAKLDPSLTSFEDTCNSIIGLLNRAKQFNK